MAVAPTNLDTGNLTPESGRITPLRGRFLCASPGGAPPARSGRSCPQYSLGPLQRSVRRLAHRKPPPSRPASDLVGGQRLRTIPLQRVWHSPWVPSPGDDGTSAQTENPSISQCSPPSPRYNPRADPTFVRSPPFLGGPPRAAVVSL